MPDVDDHSDAYPVLIIVYDEFLSGVAIAYAMLLTLTSHLDGASCVSLTLNDLIPAPGPNRYTGPDVVVTYESPYSENVIDGSRDEFTTNENVLVNGVDLLYLSDFTKASS